MNDPVRIELQGRRGPIYGYALVDAEDEALVRSHQPWSLFGGRGDARYAGHSYHVSGSGRPGRHLVVMMHRLLLGLEVGDPRVADHINRDTLDNRRANLRAVSRRENAGNAKAYGVSPYRGVSWHKSSGRWRAVVYINGVTHELGYFKDEARAGEVAREFRLAHMPGAVD